MTTAQASQSANLDLSANGFFTISSPNGGHRTFRIRTELRGPFKGARTIGLLSGPNNEEDYTDFGFVHTDDRLRVVLFRSFRSARSTVFGEPWRDNVSGNDWERFARMALDLAHSSSVLERRGYTVLFDRRCRRCNRTLTTPQSIEAGIGPECAEREMES